MIENRIITLDDYNFLELSLARDVEHPTTDPEFFYNPRTITSVYLDELGPVIYARGAKTLRLDLHFTNNADARRNLKVMLDKFPDLVYTAKENGFSEVMFNSVSPLLRKFCIKRLGFAEAPNELRREI